jgi:putative salt-induced outer membrane protein
MVYERNETLTFITCSPFSPYAPLTPFWRLEYFRGSTIIMKTTLKTFAILLASTATMTAAPAHAQTAGLLAGWSGEASASGARTTGNTDTTDLGLALNLQKESDKWRHTFYGSADFGEADDVQNKKRFTLGYQIDRDLTDRLYAWGNVDWFSDDFGAYENGTFLGTGLGYKLVEPTPLGWDVEAGIGYRSQSPQLLDVPGDVTQAEFDALDLAGDFDKQNEFALRGASKITYDFNDNVSLYNNSEAIYTKSDTYLWNEIGITANLMGNLAARASYRIDHHTDVLPGVEKTDTITRVGVVYSIN